MCDPATKTTCKETLLYAPTSFPYGFQFPEREGRICLILERLVRNDGRKGEATEGTRERAETGEWGSERSRGAQLPRNSNQAQDLCASAGSSIVYLANGV